jgi:hypothetical protein
MLPWDLARSVSSAEFTFLQAFHRMQPAGFEVENFRSGIVAQSVVATRGVRSKVSDFYPLRGQKTTGQTQEQQMAILSAAGAGVVKKKKGDD